MTSGEPTIADVCNAYLRIQDGKLEIAELSPRTFHEQRATCERLVEALGRLRVVRTLKPADFTALRAVFAKRFGPVRLANEIVRVRTIFKWAYDEEIIESSVRFGTGFSKPRKEVMRRHENAREPRTMAADELRTVVASASQPMKAFALLGINCGFGASDIATLRKRSIDPSRGWIKHKRAKTAVMRRCPLWPETTEALTESLLACPKPYGHDDGPFAFLTRFGRRWVRPNKSGSPNDEIGKQFAKLLKSLGLKRPGVNFYVLRHLVQTIGEETGDLPAVAAIMGHVDQTMAAHYRTEISDERLRKVTDHVRQWLFGEVEAKPKRSTKAKRAKREPVEKTADNPAGSGKPSLRVVG